MIPPEIRAEIRRLVLREAWAIETVARRFGIHHSTVRRALTDTKEELPSEVSVLEPYKPYIIERLTAAPELTGARLFSEVRSRGYQHSIAVLRRYVAKVRQPKSRKAYLRVETEPGEYAQVDWGSFGHLRIGSSQRPLSAFAMVLSYSRALFVDFALEQRMETFLQMHRRALEYFQGVPKRILYDNLKSVVLHHIGSTVQFNPRFLSFAGHYLFEATAAAVRYPEAKGKVESSIKYIRHSFFYGRSFSSLEDLRRQVREWMELVANCRIHGTTRERPCERLQLERPYLHKLPEHPYDTDLLLPLIVSKEARVRLDSNSYTVPALYVGKTVLLRADDASVRIFHEREEVAKHARCWERHRHIEDKAHIENLLERKKGARGYIGKEAFLAKFPEARLYLQEVARRRLHLANEIRATMRLAELYTEEEIRTALTSAITRHTVGRKYLRALMDQARFAAGLPEPTEPIVTGNPIADNLEVQPHSLESYDELHNKKSTPPTQ